MNTTSDSSAASSRDNDPPVSTSGTPGHPLPRRVPDADALEGGNPDAVDDDGTVTPSPARPSEPLDGTRSGPAQP